MQNPSITIFAFCHAGKFLWNHDLLYSLKYAVIPPKDVASEYGFVEGDADIPMAKCAAEIWYYYSSNLSFYYTDT